MGIDDRDYLRQERRTAAFGFPGGGWAIKYVIIANIAVFLAQQTSPTPIPETSLVTAWLDLRLPVHTSAEATPFEPEGDGPLRTLPPGTSLLVIGRGETHAMVRQGGEYGIVPSKALAVAPIRFWELGWRLVTYGFCHASLMHIAFNMFVLWMFGRAVEPILGSREFLAFYLAGVVVSGLCHLIVQALSPVPVLGASGGVMAVVFLTAMYYPRMTVLLMFVIPIELRWLAVLYAVLDVAGAFSETSGVAHAAHLGGAAFGVAYKYFGWRLMPFWDSLAARLRARRPASHPRVRIHRPSADEIRERVDELLDKIHRHGEASLTDAEREFLREASREYRNR
ncbi:MAG: rhomboid family intramembrane serine protease [Planctomycetales bacterium]